jgi:hypothetical protein
MTACRSSSRPNHGRPGWAKNWATSPPCWALHGAGTQRSCQFMLRIIPGRWFRRYPRRIGQTGCQLLAASGGVLPQALSPLTGRWRQQEGRLGRARVSPGAPVPSARQPRTGGRGGRMTFDREGSSGRSGAMAPRVRYDFVCIPKGSLVCCIQLHYQQVRYQIREQD